MIFFSPLILLFNYDVVLTLNIMFKCLYFTYDVLYCTEILFIKSNAEICYF